MLWLDYDTTESTVVGTLKVLPALHSRELHNHRAIYVWLPPSYQHSTAHYPVIYMQDGQNLFDEALSFAGEWCVDETMTALADDGLEAIVVGIANTEGRLNEYSPFVDMQKRGGKGDAYLKWIVGTLKPLIDQTFRTLPDAANTSMLGSSMGGLISLYAGLRYPHVFANVGAMSGSFWFAQRAIIKQIQRTVMLPQRVYVDAGTAESIWLLDAVHATVDVLQNKLGDQLVYVEALSAIHNEADWAIRLPDAVRYLLRGDIPVSTGEANEAVAEELVSES